MDDAVRRFRSEARRELGDREGGERRYSARLRQAAVAYWRGREPAGGGLLTVARELGIAPVSLRRWAQDERFRPVQMVPDPASPTDLRVVIEGTQVRVDHLDLETAVQLIARLR
jgi:transposase-like protein